MSNSQKFENILNLSLDADRTEREKSMELETGYDPSNGVWELIIKYSGDFSAISAIASDYTLLLNEFAIILIPENRLNELAALPNVEYVEKPKTLFFALEEGRRASCVTALRLPRYNLFGNGVLVATIDSGIDIYNRDFRNPDGSTRILSLWDQSIPGNPPEGSFLGSEYSETDINEYLASSGPVFPIPGEDISGHGTAVMGVAAGNGANSSGRYSGVAPEASLLVVKMAPSSQNGFPRTTQLMQGVNYAIKKALELQMPVVVNLSFGNNYGPHNNSFLLEQFLNDISNYWKNVIVIGSGNEGDSRTHTSVKLNSGEIRTVRMTVSDNEPSLNIQIWKNYSDNISITVVSPSGQIYILPLNVPDTHRTSLEDTNLLLYVGEPSPFTSQQEIYIEFIPKGDYIDPGEWRFTITGINIVEGTINLWLPGQDIIGPNTGFLEPESLLTQTVPSTAQRLIAVGAYDSRQNRYAAFSGRGSETNQKPDLVAPGVNITAPAPGNTYGSFTGTSIATPFVSGGAALLMEWGIINGNDPYLYGEKVKAYLIKGARRLPFENIYPNPRTGWGALCVADSIP